MPASYKKEETIEKYLDTQAPELWKKTGLAGISGEICSVAFALDDGPVQSVTRGVEVPLDREADLLDLFFLQVSKAAVRGEGGHQRLEWIGHNILEFDLRFLKQRTIILRMGACPTVPVDARHKNGAVFDTMKEWSGYRGYIKQSELQDAFCIPVDASLECIGGDQVADYWAAGMHKEIAEYNRDDVRVNREIHKRLIYLGM